MKIKVINNSFTEVTRAADPNERWDADDTDTFNSIEGIKIVTNEKCHYDLDTEFDVKAGREYYLVYAEYTTGDSFGSASGLIDFIQLYRTLAKAKVCIATLTAKPIDDTCQYSADIVTESGKVLTYGKPWIGYFESLDNLDIAYVMVQ